jgi:hypothetical protein
MRFNFGKPPVEGEYRKRKSWWAPKSPKERLRMSQSAYMQRKKDLKISLPEAPWDDDKEADSED